MEFNRDDVWSGGAVPGVLKGLEEEVSGVVKPRLFVSVPIPAEFLGGADFGWNVGGENAKSSVSSSYFEPRVGVTGAEGAVPRSSWMLAETDERLRSDPPPLDRADFSLRIGETTDLIRVSIGEARCEDFVGDGAYPESFLSGE